MKKLLISLVLASFLIMPVFATAQTVSTQAQLTQQLIQLLTQMITKLEQEIAQYQNQLNDIGKQKNCQLN